MRFARLMAVAGPFALAWTILFVSVPSHMQNFPLDDDAAYSESLFVLLRSGSVDYLGWASTPQLGQWVWATPFAWLLGHTFVATRLSTIAIALLSLPAFYVLLRREAGLTRREAILGCQLLALNPLFLMLSATFMTDLQSLSFSLIAMALWSVAIARGSQLVLLAGAVPGLLAVTTRQNAVVIAGVLLFLAWRKASGPIRSTAALLSAVLTVVGLGTAFWFTRQSDVGVYVPQPLQVDRVLRLAVACAAYLGLFLAPLAVFMPWRCRRSWTRAAALPIVLAVVWLLYVRVVIHNPFAAGLFPQIGNMLTVFGSFGEHYMLGSRPQLPVPARGLLTGLACLGAGWLILQMRHRWRAGHGIDALSIFALLHLPFMVISFTFFDRYLIVLLPAAIGIALWRVSSTATPSHFATAIALTCVLGIASVALVHDWLAWNAARWQLGRAAVSAGVRAADIEGGFEWNQLHALRERRMGGSPAGNRHGLTLEYHAYLFSGMSGRCGLSFGPIAGTRVIDKAAYTVWVGLDRREFLFVCTP